ncbi:MAG: zinc-binding dehydrogenase [Desulfobacterales bacterium]
MGVDSAQLAPREPEIEEQIMGKLFTWLEERALDPVVGKVFNFEDFREALETITKNQVSEIS